MSKSSGGDRPPVERLPRSDLPSVAMLPYRASGDVISCHGFADGITAEIIGSLRRLGMLFVINASSSLRYHHTRLPISEIGRVLGARYIVTGRITQTGQRLSFVQHLHDGADGTLLWTDEVRAHISDLIEVQTRIVAQIVNGIVAPLTDLEIERAVAMPPADLGAYHLLLQALPGLFSLQRHRLEQAGRLLDGAIQADPYFAAPLAMKARLNSLRIGQGWVADRASAEEEAIRLSAAAIDLDPRNSLALATAGHLSAFLKRDCNKAFELFERALICCPNDALAWSLSSITHTYCGQAAEARTRAGLAIRLSPKDRGIFHSYFCAGLAAYADGDYAEAVRWLRASIAENTRYTSSYKVLAAALSGLGHASDAGRIIALAERLEPGVREKGSRSAPIRDEELKIRYARHLQMAGALA